MITGAIIAVITCIYVGYSASIFNNEASPLRKLYPNKAYLQWKDGKYKYNYDEDKVLDEPDIAYAKYRDLGKKQYHYNSEHYKLSQDQNSEVNKCQDDTPTLSVQKTNGSGKCEYIWHSDLSEYIKVAYKYAYDRWLTAIIISVFIVACGLGLAVFGFLLFKNSGDSSSGKVPVN